MPLYEITLKRVEYLVIWRDYNFNEKNPNNFDFYKFNIIRKFHNEIKKLIATLYDLKVYYIDETEKALNFYFLLNLKILIDYIIVI